MATKSIHVAIFSSAAHRLTNGFAKTGLGLLVLMMFVPICARGQTGSIAFHEKQDVQHSIEGFSKCLQSHDAHCVARSISIRGVTLGVDGPRITRDSLVQKLMVDRGMQCLFWGTHCGSSGKCSVSDAIANVGTISTGEPRVYGEHWQVDIETKPQRACSSGLPFVFQLENGYWKLVAIPYT